MKRLVALLALVAAALAMLAVSNGCIFGSDGERLTIEDYFTQLDDSDQKATDGFDNVSQTLGQNPNIDQIKETYPDILDVVDSFANDLHDLKPPSELNDAHQGLVGALEGYRDELSKALDNLAAATSVQEAGQAFSGEELSAASQAFDDACLVVQGEADDRQVDITLGCKDTSGGTEPTPTAAP